MLDPQAAAVLGELAAAARPMPADREAWLRGYRAELDGVVAMQGAAPAASVREERGGATPVPMRFYRPDAAGPDAADPLPTVLFIHGGGFVAGSLDAYDIPLRHLCLRSGWQVAAVDYRLAPEHPYPAAPDDCMAALRHLLASAAVDPRRVAVAGDSAGGALAAVVAARARGLPLRLQVLLYPNTDLRETTGYASRALHDGAVVRMDELHRSLALYCGDADRADPDLSPGLAADLAGLCPALVVTCECDPLRDEGERHAARLAEAGVPVEALRLDGMIHSVLQRGARIAAGDALITRVAAALRAVA